MTGDTTLQNLADAYYDARMCLDVPNNYIDNQDNMYRHAATAVAKRFMRKPDMTAAQAHAIWSATALAGIRAMGEVFRAAGLYYPMPHGAGTLANRKVDKKWIK